jgi:hypothetical protein
VHRNPSATLSPTELASLRRVSIGLIKTVPGAHRDLFIIMRLAAVDDSEWRACCDRDRRTAAPKREQGTVARYACKQSARPSDG